MFLDNFTFQTMMKIKLRTSDPNLEKIKSNNNSFLFFKHEWERDISFVFVGVFMNIKIGVESRNTTN